MLGVRWNLGHLLLLALALALLWFGWRALVALQQPEPQLATSFAAPDDSATRLLATTDPFFPAEQATSDSPVTSLSLSLHGIRSDTATGRGSVILSGADGVQQVYAVGDTVADGVTLVAIAADHVQLNHQGTRESLWLDAGSGSEVQRFDPNAFEPMPVPDDASRGDVTEENLLPPSDAPALAGAAMVPAAPADSEEMQ